VTTQAQFKPNSSAVKEIELKQCKSSTKLKHAPWQPLPNLTTSEKNESKIVMHGP
jgi:hypothetical protein